MARLTPASSKTAKITVGRKILGAFLLLLVMIASSNALSLYSMSKVKEDLRYLKTTELGQNQQIAQRLSEAHDFALADYKMIIFFAPLVMMAGVGLAIAVSRNVVRPLQDITGAMQSLADGKTNFELQPTTRQDELGVALTALGNLQQKTAAAFRLNAMVDSMPNSVLFVSNENGFSIVYSNDAARGILQEDEAMHGQSLVAVLGRHWQPLYSHMGKPESLPWKGEVQHNGETFNVQVSAVHDAEGQYTGAMIAWTVVTGYRQMVASFESTMQTVVSALSNSCEQTRAASEALSQQAAKMVSKSGTVASASESTSSNVQSVAAATEEMTGSIAEIGRQIQQSTNVVQTANQQAGQASKTMQQLSASAREIGEVIDLIVDIAEQTSLLALNATIEAAAAGDAGRGFAVVAHEVKNLASETAKATEIISAKIADVQSVTENAVTSIENINNVINELQEVAATISAAIEQQSAATKEISASIAQASGATINVSTAIGEISQLSTGNGNTAEQVLHCAEAMNEQTRDLQAEVQRFLAVAKSA